MAEDVAPDLRISDWQPRDAVTTLRREVKFVVPEADAAKLRQVLDVNLKPLHYGPSEESRVYSVYFDNSRLSGCHENLEGAPVRRKLRWRWYDSETPAGTSYFELKERRGVLVRKDRLQLETSTTWVGQPYPKLLFALRHALPTPFREWLAFRPHPVALIQYRRRHYRDPWTGARVTLDYDLGCVDQLSALRVRTGPALPIDRHAILEVKTPPNGEAAVQRLLHPLRLRVTRSSKYVNACIALRLLAEQPDTL